MMQKNNLISVIVTAYNRKKFLPYALKSLESQTLPKDKFEVIVVKNFEDQISDDIIRKNGWKDMVTNVIPQGGMIAIGLEESKGNIITFLDDDDLYREDRLEKIYKTFKSVPELIYFHNKQIYIDESGRPLNLEYGKSFTIRLPPGIVDCRLAFVEPGIFHNSSSIAVVRKPLDENKHLLELIRGSLDFFIAAIALNQRVGLLFESSERLTLYRVNTMSLTPYSYTSRSSRFEMSLPVLARAYFTWALDANLIINILDENCRPYAEFYEAFRAAETASMPSWASGQRLTVNLFERLKQERKLLSLGSIDFKNYLIMVTDVTVALMPDKIKHTYWSFRWLIGKH
ncbi:glycosyltransferase family 2 protein, partial [Caldisphaera sp.]|uniref:glycosyltransferase family 2 protein n=1 Tax=Caldisphaera sp. TaxID=2060322 RepID=UPI00397927AA